MDINVKIFGNQGWSVPQYCGYIENNLAKDVLASAKVCPNISELHSQDFGFDIVERPFKLLSNKCFVISDYVQGAEEVFGDSVVFAKTPDEFKKLVLHYISHPNERDYHINKGYELVMQKHTYFHRVHQILNNLRLHDEANKCLELFNNLKQKLSL
jgi:spore maturation protein CgeB